LATLVRADQIAGSAGQNDDMARAVIISRETVGSSGIYTSIVTTQPSGRTEVHHHGECETSIYVLRGKARFYFGAGLSEVFEADAGDFVYIPAFEVHVEENARDDAELVVLLSRNCDRSVNHYVEATIPARSS
jgi:uncharacterized RmlC-like cupin family protein